MAYLFETEEHAAIRATARRFAQAHIAAHGASWEEDEEFPVELYKTAAAAGIQGIGAPPLQAEVRRSWRGCYA